METTKGEFKKLSGIDLTDHEHSGVFPYYKNGKWSSISRGKAWQMYAKWLEDKSTSQKETIEMLREGLKELVCIVKIHSKATKNNFAWAELEEAEQLLSTTEPTEELDEQQLEDRRIEELDEQQLEDRRIEELTERNVKIVGDFMEHCESEGFIIPDHLYESYFNV